MEDYRLDIRDIREAYKLTKEFIEKVKRKADKPVLLLTRLYEKTEEHLNSAINKNLKEVRFTPEEITGESEEDSYPVRYTARHKNGFKTFVEEHKTELVEFLQSRNVNFQLSIETIYINKNVHYFLAVRSLLLSVANCSQKIIEYSVEELPEPKWWVKPFVKMVFDGWKKWLFIFAPFLISIFFVGGFYYYLQIAPAPIYFAIYASLVAIFTFIYYIAKPFYLTLDNSIAIVSNWMLRISQRTGQVEMHYLDEKDDQGYQLRELRLSIYSAKCPICIGAVFIDNGKYEFKGRLIFKCL